MNEIPNCNDLKQRIKALEESAIEARRLQVELQASEEKYRLLVENATDIIFRTSVSGRFIFFNPAALKFTGYAASELIGKHFTELIRSDRRPEAERFYSMQFVKKIPVTYYEFPIINKNQEEIWIGQQVQSIMEDGQVIGFQAIARDITERKEAEEKLRHEEHLFRTLAEQSSDIIILVNRELMITYESPAIKKVLGYTVEERIGSNLFDHVHPDDLKFITDASLILANKKDASTLHAEVLVRHRDGSWRTLEVTANNIVHDELIQGGILNLHDITERKAAEKALKESEAQYRLLADHMKDQIWLMDLQLKPTYISPSVEKILGFTLDELKQLPLDKLLTPASFKVAMDFFSMEMPRALAAPQTNIKTRSLELEFNCKNGQALWEEIKFSTIRDENGKPSAMLGEGRDITERKKIEEKLRHEENRFKALAEQSSDIIVMVNRKAIITYENPAAAVLGINARERIGGNALDNVYPDDLKSIRHEINKLFADINAPAFRSEIRLRHKDGSWRMFEIMASGLSRGNSVESVIVNFRDITERKLVEQDLKKSEERYRSVFENAGLPMVIMEDSLLIFMVNDRFVEMSGYGKVEIEGRMKFTDFITSGDRNALMECFSRRKGDKPVEYECKIAHRNGEQFDVLIRLGQIPGTGQFIASFTDITLRKQAELALLESQEHLQKENIRLRSSIRERYRFCDIIGKSQVMQEVYDFIIQAATTQAHVIIYGESGTGKELVAKAIHETSERRQKRFVTVHCGAIPETLMESEFFGYKKGAFTGANMDKGGYLDEADGGTLFLDEVGEIGLNMQVKLLRTIAGDGYTPVGSSMKKNADVRIVAATNRNLRELVKQGVMRDDFFYRIHILPIYLPPLRDRKEDMPLLIDHFLQSYDKNHPLLPGQVTEALLNYDWPGNIRELQNVLQRYLTLKRLDFAGGPTTLSSRLKEHLLEDGESVYRDFTASADPVIQTKPAQDHNNIEVEEFTVTLKSLKAMKARERDYILKALSEHDWNRGATASALGINRKTLYRKMQKFGLVQPY